MTPVTIGPMLIAAGLSVTLVGGTLHQMAADRPDAISLESNRRIERSLTRGIEHRYQIALSAGEFVGLAVERLGVDLVVQTRDVDGRVIAEFQDGIGKSGIEPVGVVADSTGIVTVAIDAAPGTTTAGAYAISLTTRRA